MSTWKIDGETRQDEEEQVEEEGQEEEKTRRKDAHTGYLFYTQTYYVSVFQSILVYFTWKNHVY